jgi:hypothetical protein
MNIVVTKSLGDAIFNLKGGWRINRIKRSRMNAYYLWAPEFTHGEAVRLAPDLVKQLEKTKLIEGGLLNYRETYWRRTSRVYRATDACMDFRLPPEEFWVPDEPSS